MKKEIDLLKNYPKTKRDTSLRAQKKSETDIEIARQFGKDFFDGGRQHGYGGFNYNEKFWKKVVEDFKDHWKVNSKDKILDVGCAKGFMVYDFKNLIPEIHIEGVDISNYAIENSKPEVKKFLKVADAKNLPYENDSFDYVISINTIHNLNLDDCKKALKEIQRVSKKDSFITVDAYNNTDEKNKMFEWNLTAKTILSVKEWKELFEETGYTGDYFWFIP